MKFCFFGDVSSAIRGKTSGGAELQVALLATALASKGHDIVLIDPYSHESFTTPEGVKVINVPEWSKGWKGARMFFYRIPALWRIFVEQKADYYYVRMRSFVHLLPYWAAKKNGGKFVQAIASDVDLFSISRKYKYEYKPNFRLFAFLTQNLPNDLVFRHLVKNSHYLLLQHVGQQFSRRTLKSNQVIFPNIIDFKSLPVYPGSPEDYYIYAGSLTMLKGADKLLNLVDILDKSITIMIVGLPRGEKPALIYEQLRKKKNVILQGQKSHKETIEFISKAKALINTSYFEGFPNIYLEAWGTGVPVISLSVNPGNIFDRYNLGVYCKNDLNRMKYSIETNQVTHFNKGELRAYVYKNHDLETAAERFLNTIAANHKV